MTINWAEFTVAELRDRAGEDAFGSAGAHIVDMDGPHEDEWSLYTTITLQDGQELETILHRPRDCPRLAFGLRGCCRVCEQLCWP